MISVFGNRRASTVLEFALVFPIFMIFILGTLEFIRLSRATMKLEQSANTLGDLIAQQSSLTGGQLGKLGSFCQAAMIDMLPYDTRRFSASLASFVNDATGTAKGWQDNNACAAPATGFGTATMETASGYLKNPGDSIIVVKVNFQYRPITGMFFHDHIDLDNTVFVRPRMNTPVPCAC